jgi:hypothetical protein
MPNLQQEEPTLPAAPEMCISQEGVQSNIYSTVVVSKNSTLISVSANFLLENWWLMVSWIEECGTRRPWTNRPKRVVYNMTLRYLLV